MGEPLYVIIPSNRTSVLVDEDGNRKEVSISDVFVKNEDVLSELPDTIVVGAFAYTAGFKKMWHKDFTGSWVPINS